MTNNEQVEELKKWRRERERCGDKKVIGGILLVGLFAFIFLNPATFFATILGFMVAPSIYNHATTIAEPPAITLQISDYKWDGQYVQPLLTAINNTNTTYSYVNWSCNFLDASGNVVDEDSMHIQNVSPGKTSKRSIAMVRHSFDSISCRLNDWRK